MKDLGRIYIMDLDRKEVINSVYEYFKNKKVDYFYNELLKYDTKIDKQFLIPSLTSDELNQLSSKESIDIIHGIRISIYFNGEYLMFENRYYNEFINILYNLKRSNNLFNSIIYGEYYSQIKEYNDQIKNYNKLIDIQNKKIDIINKNGLNIDNQGEYEHSYTKIWEYNLKIEEINAFKYKVMKDQLIFEANNHREKIKRR